MLRGPAAIPEHACTTVVWQAARVSSPASRAFLAALRAGGIRFVTAFPGSPTTNLALLLEREGADAGIEFRWAINENAAISQAFGAAMAGCGSAVIMKHVGLNVAADALHVMGVVHALAAPLLLFEGADAKPGSSQSAQDNRGVYAGSPNLLVVTPSSPAEIVELVGDACAISRAAGMMVVVRGDHRSFACEGELAELPPVREHASAYPSWPARARALATSARTYAEHLDVRRSVLARLRPWIDAQALAFGQPRRVALVVAAHLGLEIGEAARTRGLAGLRMRVEHPLPSAELLALARRVDELVVLEECTDLLEQQVRALLQREGLTTRVLGRSELGDARPIGRIAGESLAALLDAIAARESGVGSSVESPGTRVDPLALLDGLPAELLAREAAFEQAHPLSSFPALDPRGPLFDRLRALEHELGKPVFIATDPGITGVLALARSPLDGRPRSDVKMHMGGAVPLAAGWSRGCPEGLAIAVVGDTNLPHSEWLGLIDAADHGDDLLVLIADNGSSEMTQRIVTPRVAPERAIASFEAIGVRCWSIRATVDPADPWAAVLGEAARERGPRLVWVDVR